MNERPLTPRARKVLDFAQREAVSLGHNYVGTEHILLGLLDEGTGVASRVLFDFDVDSGRVRNAVIRIVGTDDPGDPGEDPGDPETDPRDPEKDQALLTEIRDALVRIADALERSKR